MIFILNILKILLYFLFCRLTYLISLRSYRNSKTRLTWWGVIFCSVLFAIYSILITNPNLELSHDRLNYYERFSNDYDISLDSLGLNFLFVALRTVSFNQDFLWFSTGFLFVFITLIAYRYYKDALPYAILFLLCSNFVTFGYGGMKQSFANAIASLSLVVYFNRGYISNRIAKSFSYVIIITLVILSILFHEASYLLILVYLALALWKYPFLRKVGWFIMIASIIAFPLIMKMFFADIGMISESLEEQTMGYADGGDAGAVGNLMTTFKGVPFYIITFVGFKERKRLLPLISEYDKYLLLSALVSLTVVASFFNYWYFRFGMLLYLPVFAFASMLRYRTLLKWKKWIDIAFIITVLLTLKDLMQYYFIYGGI